MVVWSGRRVSNSRPQPWQGCALPTELLPRTPRSEDWHFTHSAGLVKANFWKIFTEYSSLKHPAKKTLFSQCVLQTDGID